MKRFLPVLLLVSALIPHLSAASLAGVNLPDSATVGGKQLLLNGMGLRTKVFFKVYVAGLYLEEKTKNPDTVIQSERTKRVVLHFLRSVSRDKMVEAYTEAFDANAPGSRQKLRSQVDAFLATFEAMNEGDRIVISYVPSIGTEVSVKGRIKATIPGQAFARALFACWFGSRPASGDLKDQMLGK